MAAAVMGIVAILPGMPTFAFGGLSLGTGSLAYYAFKRKDARAALVAPTWPRPKARPRKSRFPPHWHWIFCASNWLWLAAADQ